MFRAETNTLTRILIVAATASTLILGTASAASASTDTTEPTEPTDAHTTEGHAATAPATMAADGAAEPSSPEAAAFCEAELAAEAASNSGDPALIGPAFDAAIAAAPADLAPSVEALFAAVQSGDFGPAFLEPYAVVIDYLRDNCGYAELAVTGSEYAFGGVPEEVPAGPTIISLQNIGEEVHEIVIFRINDEVTMTGEEVFALPEEEADTMITFQGAAIAFPGDVGGAVVNFTPGRYVAVCFLLEGSVPDVFEQLQGPGSSTPPGVEVGPPHFILGMIHDFDVA